MSMPEASRSLVAMRPRATALITDVGSEHDDAVRLKALGLCVGQRVELIQAGDPLIVRVLGARVGLSARVAAQVLVESA